VKYVVAPAAYVLGCILVYKLLALSGLISVLQPMELFFLKQWDAWFYASIAQEGYRYSWTEASNSGFFPLFPYLWKLAWKVADAGVPGICMLNAAIFFAGMLVLKRTYRFSWPYFFLFVSVPANMFMLVPYSEACFFLSSAVMLYGMKTDRPALALAGLFFASLSRPTATFFIPAVICAELFHFSDLRTFLKRTLSYTLVCVLAVLIVVTIQYMATGVWFAYFRAQGKFWNHTPALPEFPFTTWGGPRTMWLDAMALFFGIAALAMLIRWLAAKFRAAGAAISGDRTVTFSLAYIAIACVYVIVTNGKDAGGGTTLISLNRYIMATSFFSVILWHLTHAVDYSRTRTAALYLLGSLIVVLSINTDSPGFFNYEAPDKIWYKVLVALNICLYPFAMTRLRTSFVAMICIVNMTAQVYLLHEFAYSKWIG
jgi:hypothetical protein